MRVIWEDILKNLICTKPKLEAAQAVISGWQFTQCPRQPVAKVKESQD